MRPFRPFPLAHLVPRALQGIIADGEWDRRRLRALALPVEELPIAALRWQLDLPWWRDGARHFAVTPNQVRADPSRYAEQWQRTNAADLRFPIHVLDRGERLTVLDGVHRLLQADCAGRRVMSGVRVSPALLATVACR